MEFRLLVDAIVRQTMVLVAQLATAAGSRSPLSRVADQVFISLVQELDRQGVGRKIAADMFGLALRSYQERVQRMTESGSEPGMTLWAAVRQFIESKRVVSKAQVLARFSSDNEASVRSVLSDLVNSGLVYSTGRADSAIFRIAPTEDVLSVQPEAMHERHDALIWVQVLQNGPVSAVQLAAQLPLRASEIHAALERLLLDGRIRSAETHAETTYTTERCFIPMGDTAGWEAGVIDHLSAMTTALAAKVQAGRLQSGLEDQVGGSTFRFELWKGHPNEAEVRNLLRATRVSLAALWDRVSEYNRSGAQKPEETYSAVFYFGQHVQVDTQENDA